ncbi:hypothetical protein [Geotalea uraniireducens]|uniref:hypothetical protein n=1 Tax=Geotalea uraniireducens TaxID=351604 RepID=UPI0002E73A29|nr:hypothetical protein [Geotalea uraniireducens]
MKNKILIVTIVFVAGLAVFTKCNFADDLSKIDKQTTISNVLKSLDKPILYYGKVLDNNNLPVISAQVSIQIIQAVGVKEIVLSTDNQGIFEVSAINGSGLLVNKITASGYDYLRINRAKGHDEYENDGSTVIDRNNPVVFTMRKKEPPTVVIPGDISVVFKKDVKYYEVDLVDMVDGAPYYLKRYHSDNAHADLKARVEYISAEDAYNFILETPDADSGIIALDQMLYVPPETGYKNIYKVKVTNGQMFKTYLYIKSRGGGIYSNLDIKFVNQNGEVFFKAEVWTNPLGERNLDFDGDKYRAYLANKNASAERMGTKPQ